MLVSRLYRARFAIYSVKLREDIAGSKHVFHEIVSLLLSMHVYSLVN